MNRWALSWLGAATPPLPCRPGSPAGAGCAAGWPWGAAGARRQPPPPLLPLRSSACPRMRTWRACRCSGPRSGLSETRATIACESLALSVSVWAIETEPSGVHRRWKLRVETRPKPLPALMGTWTLQVCQLPRLPAGQGQGPGVSAKGLPTSTVRL